MIETELRTLTDEERASMQTQIRDLDFYQKQVEDSKMPWPKPVLINNPIAGNPSYDDFFKLKQYRNECKLYKFKVFCRYKQNSQVIDWLNGVQFFYKTRMGLVIPGYEMRQDNNVGETKEIELQDDEYPVELNCRAGLYLDYIGMTTNKGRKIGHGGQGGGVKEVKAPPGTYFNIFGGIAGGDSLISVMCDICTLPENNEQKSKKINIPYDELKEMFPLIFNFLQIRDIFNIFQVSSYFGKFRLDESVFRRIANRIIMGADIQQREYVEQVLLLADQKDYGINQIKNLMATTGNKIPNPFGDLQYQFFKVQNGGDGFSILQRDTQPYRKSCFITSYGWCSLQYSSALSDLFESSFLEKLNEGKAILVAGCYFKEPGFGAEGNVALIIEDKKQNQVLFQKKKTAKPLNKAWQRFFIRFQKEKTDEQKLLTPTHVTLTISGKDTCYWAGHYGAIISGITLRGLPYETKEEREYAFSE